MRIASTLGLVAIVSISGASTRAQSESGLVAALRAGHHVLVMRHAASPREAPDKLKANADNVTLERQLDDTGRSTAVAMGKALRDLKIPVGEVLSSPTYRALETVRLAELPAPKAVPELGDGGQSMQAVAENAAAWLRDRVKQFPSGANTIIVTHMPNISRAFPEWGAVFDGEAVVLGSDGRGGIQVAGRIKIEDWPRLR